MNEAVVDAAALVIAALVIWCDGCAEETGHALEPDGIYADCTECGRQRPAPLWTVGIRS